MNALEHQLHYPLGERLPERGRAIELAPGVKWLRMSLPFALDHINLWLLRDRWQGPDGERDGWAIVDCGISDDATRSAWEQVFASELDGLPVLRVIATHMHPDHIGLAHWLTERWGCELWISATDWYAARLASQSTTGVGGDAAAAHFARHGVADPDTLAKVRRRSNYYASMVPQVPARFHRLMEGQVLSIGERAWRCHAGYGHAPEHIALHCPAPDGQAEATARAAIGKGTGEPAAARHPGLLISGDMVLPRISTNVMVSDIEPESDPLRLYLASLERLRALPAGTLVLPAHGKPFGGATAAAGSGGLHTRIDQLVQHHEQRLADVLAACRDRPTTAMELLPVLFKRPLDLHQTTFALGEAIAHLHALWFQGRLVRRLGADGMLRFAAAG